jgi:iron complex outermembrane recepter protein
MSAVTFRLLPVVAAGLAIPVHAQDAAPGGTIQEIVVSAQRRGDEKLVETPVSIGVLTGAALDKGSSRSVADVLNTVGGVTLTESRPGASEISIRGVVAGTGTSTTGYYLDELPFSFIDISEAPDASAYDLERVEVLRGPQGTLYGANALSGVVRILTKDADLDGWEAKGRVRGSSTHSGGNNYGGDLAVNVPLIPDKLAVRAVASYSDFDGFIRSSLTNEDRINDAQTQAYRLKVNYLATENLSVKFGATHSQLDSGAPSVAQDDFTTPFSGNQADDRTYDAFNLVLEYDADKFSVLSATSYLDYSLDTQREILLSGVSRLNYHNRFTVEILSQEVRFTSALDGPWQWSGGAYYKEAKQNQFQDARPTFPNPFEDDNESKSYAVFAELTRSFADGRFELTGGLRYFNDDLTSTERSNFFATPLSPPRDGKFDRVTGRVVLKYNLDDDYMLYGSVASGFRSGVNQTSAVAAIDASFPPVDPDSLITYEAGAKGIFWDGKAQFDTAVYFTQWTDVQQSLILPVGFFARVNAGDASGLGADASLLLQPTDNLSLQLSVGWNDLQFDEDILQRGVVLFPQDTRLNNSPELTASFGGEYRFPIGLANLGGVLGTSMNYSSEKTLRSLTSNVLTQSESDSILQAVARLGVEADRWTAELYAENLFDEGGSVTAPDLGGAFNTVRLRPRTIGIQATFKF